MTKVAQLSKLAKLTVAIAKGRLQSGALDLFAKAGLYEAPKDLSSRRLAIENESGGFRFIFVKPMDVPVYVEHGIADCGIVGRDVLLESEANVLQPLTLDIGRCRIVVAAPDYWPGNSQGMLRVATKHPHIAATHFGRCGQPVEVIKLSGSVELAPVLGLADCIVDLVETGRTLRDNGLRITDVIAESSGRFVVNRASYQLKTAAVTRLIAVLEANGVAGRAEA